MFDDVLVQLAERNWCLEEFSVSDWGTGGKRPGAWNPSALIPNYVMALLGFSSGDQQ
jgi:hypothetical protein